MYKLSRYNKLFITPKGRYAYSGLKGTLVKIVDDSTWGYLSGEETMCEGIEQLHDAGFVVSESIDERMLVIERQNNTKDSEPLSLQIAPTLSCNFGCKGCIQGNQHIGNPMSQSIQDAVVEFAKAYRRPLRVNWYGGEPLLDMNAINYITEKLTEYVNNEGLTLESSMTTNGYLVSDELALILTKKLHIREYQITLDGPEKVHDKRRFLVDGSPTFRRILSGIISLHDHGAIIKVRINVDNENWDEVSNLLDVLGENGLYDIYLTAGMMHGCANDCALMTTQEFSSVFATFQNLLYEKGFSMAADAHFPKAIRNSCMMSYPYAFLIDPNGLIYNCLDHINNPNLALGSIINWSEPKKSYIEHPPLQSKCIDCNALPYCMGGCPAHYDDPFQGCNVWKSATESVIRSRINNT